LTVFLLMLSNLEVCVAEHINSKKLNQLIEIRLVQLAAIDFAFRTRFNLATSQAP